MITLKTKELLSCAANYLPYNPIVVEAGAFKGHDTIAMALRWPQGVIHAFEPLPAIFNELEQNTQHLPNVCRYQLALSDTVEQKKLYLAYKKDQFTQASSLHEPYQRAALSSRITFDSYIMVDATTLGSWAAQNGISTIDLLWLDLQGHDHAVLAAAIDILAHVTVLHTEVYFAQGYKDHMLYEPFVAWLQERDFVPVARDFSDTPKWFFGNIVCINRNKVKI